MMPSINSEITDFVQILTIQNVDRRNAVSANLLHELKEKIDHIDLDIVRCVVIRGEGEKAFCSGYDLTALPDNNSNSTEFVGPLVLKAACHAIETCLVPTIAALKGACFGAGGEIAISCDLRYAAKDLKFGMPPAKLGIIYEQEGLHRFIQVVGLSKTKELFFRAHTLGCAEALDIGMVNQIVDSPSFFSEVVDIACSIAANAPIAVQGMKKILDSVGKIQLTKAQQQEFDRMRLNAFTSNDYAEGISAMAAGRKPEFSGS